MKNIQEVASLTIEEQRALLKSLLMQLPKEDAIALLQYHHSKGGRKYE